MKSTKTILVVDDNRDIRDLLKYTLQNDGYDVFAAEDGRAALRRLEDGLKPDLVLSDIQMPHLSGTELAQLVAEKYTALPVMLMSGHIEITKEDLAHLGVRSFIRKPFDLRVLKACIEDCIELNRLVSKIA